MCKYPMELRELRCSDFRPVVADTDPKLFSLVSGTMVEVVYGHRVITTDDIYVKLSDHAVELGCQIGTMGGTIIDILPFCKASFISLLFSPILT